MRRRAAVKGLHPAGFPAIVALAAMLLSACSSIGPGSIQRDRFDYSSAISDSWKQQMLLNIVKLRYGDPPVFMDVASIINQYEFSGQVQAGAVFNGGLFGKDTTNLGGNARYADRPTITYQPLTGQQFARSLLSPLEPGKLFALVQAGYPIEFVFTVGVRAINGVRNRSDMGLLKQTGDPAFARLLRALQAVQRSQAIGMRLKKTEAGIETVMFFPKDLMTPTIQQQVKLARDLLGLTPGVHEFTLEFGLLPQGDNEIAIQSRSMLEILIELAADVDVPEAHLADGRAAVVADQREDDRLLRIRSQSEPPEDAFVAVPYANHWFWIDNKDLRSKRALTFMMILFSLAETGAPAQVPVVTVGAGS
ncbi:MAG: hypothetical protein U9Q71_07030 [Pseudomonadota bacterium]|nr:hypothetical protein [Pseudomonadota bacterium]